MQHVFEMKGKSRMCIWCLCRENVAKKRCGMDQEMRDALLKFAEHGGPTWKAKIRNLWQDGEDADNLPLRMIRNLLGARGLARLTLPKSLEDKKIPAVDTCRLSDEVARKDILALATVGACLRPLAQSLVGLERHEAERALRMLSMQIERLRVGDPSWLPWKRAVQHLNGPESYGLERIGLWPAAYTEEAEERVSD